MVKTKSFFLCILAMLVPIFAVQPISQAEEVTQQGVEFNTSEIAIDASLAKKASEGASFLRSDQYEAAIRVFKELIKLRPNEAGFHNNIAFAKFNLAKKEMNRGNVKVATKLHYSAIADMTQAIKLDPDNGDYYKTRGFIKRAIGDNTFKGDFAKADDLTN